MYQMIRCAARRFSPYIVLDLFPHMHGDGEHDDDIDAAVMYSIDHKF